jgi:hypothetical protein
VLVEESIMQAVLEEWRELEQQWRLEKQKTLPGTATAAATTSGSLELSLATSARGSATGHSTPATAMTSAEGGSCSTSRAMTPSGQRLILPKASLLDLSKSLSKASRSAAAAAKGEGFDAAAFAAASPIAAGHVMVEVPVVDLGDEEQPSCQGQMLTVTPAAYLPPGAASHRSTSSTTGAVSERRQSSTCFSCSYTCSIRQIL